MKKLLVISAIILVILFVVLVYYIVGGPKEAIKDNYFNKNMEITSPAFGNNNYIPSKYTCDGESINPPLEFSGVPSKAESLVLIMDDPDAPRGTFVHWVVFNIDPATEEIIENNIPNNSIEGVNSAGKNSYVGPCPPSGTHRYFFKLYALDKKFDLRNNAGKKEVEAAMAGHILGQAEIIGLYKRK